ncbi:tautomerase family protein [Amycolatopsis kentuckyensis]|uniref:tautomerase family protein n=1 Tax=Amycolatopsis kentuckyensis TaxID=218823 RepID=UPI000A3C9A27|nr:tautomerase family protein [Amycolatopsis kentuckyensis]
MPVVHVNWWKGAGEPERRQLVEEVTGTVSRLAKCPEAAVTVIITDVEKDHWGLGGKLAGDP